MNFRDLQLGISIENIIHAIQNNDERIIQILKDANIDYVRFVGTLAMIQTKIIERCEN